MIVTTAALDVETAVRSMKEGAFDYLVKPVEEAVCGQRSPRPRSAPYCAQMGASYYLLRHCRQNNDAFAGILTQQSQDEGAFQYLEAVAASAEPVLISGETGAGKEMFAHDRTSSAA
ncbi:MAG: sigma 54-interacting transcriptional regulator [Candidatus Accumulibacter sp.]|uniref:Sigma 54-interacting transcriptional regulator n=1 Tax=Candidatus Accumulibacter proximus TaxID=2954385 RepID=A0A935PXC0_9PROT|nr:sigma 54-interacting transcriptional regulator [Candidatus Accumulibacter proximus]